MRRVIASPEQTAADARLHERDPEHGARRREGLLLAAYAVLFLIGVWTVVVSELVAQQPDPLHTQKVTEPTQNAAPTGP